MQRWAVGVVLGGIGIAVGLCPGTARADYYSYTQENGTKAYTDDARRVPARYRDAAETHAEKPLAEYKRFTASEKPRRPGERVYSEEELRAATFRERLLAEEPEIREEAPRTPRRTIDVEIGGLTVPVEDDALATEPLFVERGVYRWYKGRYTPFTIVRRGNRVLSEIEERHPY
jgi:hypothetical protein